MASEIRVNSLTNRSGLSTVSITDTGVVVAGVITATNFSGSATGLIETPDITVNNIQSGVVTATTFIGDGSGLTGVTASGSGINIKDNGSIVGVAATVDFSTNLNVSPASAGIVTVTVADTDFEIADKIVHTGNVNTAIRFPASNTFTVDTNGSERLRVTANGAVGVNTTSVTFGLFQVTQDTNVDEGGIGILDSTKSRSMRLYCTDTLGIINSGDGGAGNLILNEGSGKIGIGTDDPNTELDVAGAISLRNGSELNGFRTNSDGKLEFFRNGSSNNQVTLVIDDADGDVGIGTTNPTQKLEVLGNTLLKGTSSTGTALQIKGAGTQGDDALISFTNGYTQTFKIGMSDDIGPARDFIISETSTGSSSDNENPKYIFNGNGDGIFQITDKAGGDVKVQLNSNGISYLNGGNVGIATNNPERLLSLRGSNAMIQLEGTGGNGKQWSIVSSDDTTGAAAASGPGNFVIYDDSSGGLGDVLTLTGVGGSMGLGTNTPDYLLDVKTSANQIARFETTSTADLAIELKNAQGSIFFGLGGGEEFAVGTSWDLNSSDNLFVIKQDGKVGINIVNPDATLHVADIGSTIPCVLLSGGTDSEGDLAVPSNEDFNIGHWSGSSFNERVRLEAGGVMYMQNSSAATQVKFGTIDGSDFENREHQINVYGHSTSDYTLLRGCNTADGTPVFDAYVSGSRRCEIEANGDIHTATGTFGSISDARFKENIVNSPSQWEDIKALKVRKFNFTEASGYQTHIQIGYVAQEVEQVSPGLVKTRYEYDEDGNEISGSDYKTVKSSLINVKAVKALQEAMARIEVLESRLNAAGIAT